MKTKGLKAISSYFLSTLPKLQNSRSLITIFEINLQYTLARCENY
jgi:hypothetical protein